MSGHSKWSTIKRAKASTDAKRGAIFTKMANLITIASRDKGGDPDTNFSLRMAIDKARSANVPKDNIERAIKKGTGEDGGAAIEELIYEGIGPANSQFVVKVLTDNKNRSAASVRHAFTKAGGSLGSVMWNFDQKGVIRVSKAALGEANIDNDELELELIDVGAEDIKFEEEGATVVTSLSDLQSANKFLEDKGIKTESAELEYLAKDEQEVSVAEVEKLEKFVDVLDENEDVSDYYHNIANL